MHGEAILRLDDSYYHSSNKYITQIFPNINFKVILPLDALLKTVIYKKFLSVY
jgi:hypothetical protein